jgi:hypothetical protein
MPLGDSPLEPILMILLQIIQRPPLLHADTDSTTSAKEEMVDPFVITGIPNLVAHGSGDGGSNILSND